MKSTCTRLIASLVLVVLACVLGATPGFAQEQPLPRKILVFFNSAAGQSPEANSFFEGLQVVANYYGFLPEYRDVAKRPLPDRQEMQSYQAIVSVFDGQPMKDPDEYLDWLLGQLESGQRLIVLGDVASGYDLLGLPTDEEMTAEVYAFLGLTLNHNDTKRIDLIQYDHIGPHMAFERELPEHPPEYVQFVPGPDTEVWLSLRRNDIKNSQSAVVVTNANGAFAMSPYTFWEDPITYNKQWYIDPFEFMTKGLGLNNAPALTPTTLNGSRVAFSHLDGDAFHGYTDLDKEKNCAQILMEEIFLKYDFPITASVIVAEIDPELYGTKTSIDLARQIFALPNIEPASHTYSHPFYWDASNKDKENVYHSMHGYKIKGYTLDSLKETAGSCDYITKNLAPKDKPCKVLLWSGDCEPTEKDIRISEENGLLNMNGGDTVYNYAIRDSLFYVSGLYRKVGNQYQVFTPQANENIMTNFWSSPLYGFRNTIDTLVRTEEPRRLMAIDIYYHFYSGEKVASVQALKDVYDWVISQDVAPVFASSYIKMVRSYLHAKIGTLGTNIYTVRDYGDCLSVRFDAGGNLPDLGRCENVLGYERIKQGLFVHLAPGKDKAVIALTLPHEGTNTKPFIKQSSGWVHDFKATQHSISLRFEGYGSGFVILEGLHPGGTYELSGTATRERSLMADDQGLLAITPLYNGTLKVTTQ